MTTRHRKLCSFVVNLALLVAVIPRTVLAEARCTRDGHYHCERSQCRFHCNFLSSRRRHSYYSPARWRVASSAARGEDGPSGWVGATASLVSPQDVAFIEPFAAIESKRTSCAAAFPLPDCPVSSASAAAATTVDADPRRCVIYFRQVLNCPPRHERLTGGAGRGFWAKTASWRALTRT